MPNTGRIGEQHDDCAISGFTFPVSQTFVQRGRRVSFQFGDLVPNTDFYRSTMDILEGTEAEVRILPEGPVEEIAP